LLYPAELQAQNGAGDGNRTHTASLEGWNSTIELHPQLTADEVKVYHIFVVMSTNNLLLSAIEPIA
jgi:hypothetical protein